MYKAQVNNSKEEIKIDKETLQSADIIKVKEGEYHLIRDNKSYNLSLLKADYDEKILTVRVNGNKYTVQLKDKFDELLHDMGFDNMSKSKMADLKAPMPGLVLEIRVSEGQAVKKGDALIVLEAMKMENIIKSPADGTVKKISIKKGTPVEKNQVLIHF